MFRREVSKVEQNIIVIEKSGGGRPRLMCARRKRLDGMISEFWRMEKWKGECV